MSTVPCNPCKINLTPAHLGILKKLRLVLGNLARQTKFCKLCSINMRSVRAFVSSPWLLKHAVRSVGE